MELEKGGITMTFNTPSEIAYYKNLGYKEVKPEPEVEEKPKK